MLRHDFVQMKEQRDFSHVSSTRTLSSYANSAELSRITSPRPASGGCDLGHATVLMCRVFGLDPVSTASGWHPQAPFRVGRCRISRLRDCHGGPQKDLGSWRILRTRHWQPLSLSRAGRLINSEASANGPHESPLDWWSLSFARHIPGEALSWPMRRWPKHHLHSLLITLSFLAFYTFVGRALRMARPSARR